MQFRNAGVSLLRLAREVHLDVVTGFKLRITQCRHKRINAGDPAGQCWAASVVANIEAPHADVSQPCQHHVSGCSPGIGRPEQRAPARAATQRRHPRGHDIPAAINSPWTPAGARSWAKGLQGPVRTSAHPPAATSHRAWQITDPVILISQGPPPPVTGPSGVAWVLVRGDPFGYVVDLQYLAPPSVMPSFARLRALATEPGLESI